MATQFFIDKEGYPAPSDIELSLGIRIASVRGLNPANPKELFTRDWANEDGVDVYLPTSRKKQPTEVTMTVFAESSSGTTAMQKYDNFCAALFDGEFDYWDTLQNKKVTLIYTGNKPSWYQFITPHRVMFEATFLNATGATIDV